MLFLPQKGVDNMNSFEQLNKRLVKNHIKKFYYNLPEGRKGVTIECDKEYGIFIDKTQIESLDEEFCVTVHEYGHCVTGATHNVCSKFDLIEKHEYKANRKSIIDFLPLRKLQKAFDADCREIWQIAEFFDLPYKFVEMSINYYKSTGKIIS